MEAITREPKLLLKLSSDRIDKYVAEKIIEYDISQVIKIPDSV